MDGISALEKETPGTSLMGCLLNAENVGSVPDWGTKIPHAMRYGQTLIKRERESSG